MCTDASLSSSLTVCRFGCNAGMDIAKGMLGLPPDRFGRKDFRMTFDMERKAVRVVWLLVGRRGRRCYCDAVHHLF